MQLTGTGVPRGVGLGGKLLVSWHISDLCWHFGELKNKCNKPSCRRETELYGLQKRQSINGSGRCMCVPGKYFLRDCKKKETERNGRHFHLTSGRIFSPSVSDF